MNSKKKPTIAIGARVAWASQAQGSERTKIGIIVDLDSEKNVKVEVKASYAGCGPATNGTKITRHKPGKFYRPLISALREPNAKEVLEVIS